MAGYTRVDTSNNIADGNVIAAADLDNEFDGVQAAFSASTGHTHGGAVGEGAPIVKLGPTNDVTISATLLAPKTTNTVDIGSSSLKYKDLWLAGNASIAGTLAVTGVATLTAQPVLSSLTASSAVATDASKGLVSVTNTGTGNNVLATSPTLVTPALGTPSSGVVTNLTGTASININGTVGATTASTGAFTSLTDSGNLAFTGTGNRITGDFSNATIANRVAFQTSTTNGNTLVAAIPNGTSTTAGLWVYNNSDLTNAGRVRMTASSTEMSFNADYNGTGTYLPMTFYTGGSERVRVDTAGNVGIGTSSPAFKLDVDGPIQLRATGAEGGEIRFLNTGNASTGLVIDVAGANAARIFSTSNSFNLQIGQLGGTGGLVSFFTAGAERVRIDASGNVGVGTAAPPAKLTVTAATNDGIVVNDGTVNTIIYNSTGGVASIGTTTNHPVDFYANNAARMRITSTGNVGIGTSSPAVKFNVVGGRTALAANSETFALGLQYSSSAGLYYIGATNSATPDLVFSQVGGTERMRIADNGIVTMGAYGAGAATFSAAGVISSVSDETWKIKDGVPVNPDAMIKKLEPGYWFYKDGKKDIFGADRQLGFYAQNVNAAIGPEAAPEPEEGKPWGYYDRSVLAVVVMSLQKALATIESLEARVATLESKP